MTTTKTLMLAGLAALSLGVGTAMAQEGGGPSMPSGGHWQTFWAPGPLNLNPRAPAAAQDQAGSSDAVSTHYRANRGVGAHYDYSDMANPG